MLPSLAAFLQALAAGVTVGGAYALMCIGLGIIFGSMRVINFAQGDFLMLGMYAAFYLTAGYGILNFLGPYAGPIIAAFLAGPIVFAIGWVVHRFVVSRVTGAGVASSEGAGAYGQIIVTLGLSLILQNGGLIVFGSTPEGIRTPLSRRSWEIGPVLLNQARVVSFLVAVALVVGVYLFLARTRIGKALRAAADNSAAALYMGIDVDRAHRIAWSLGVGITAIAGGLVGGLAVFSALCRVRFRHRDVCRGGAGRPRQHPRRVLGRAADRHHPADVDPGAALPAAEHGDLCRLSADHLPAAAGAVRPSQRTHMTGSAARQRWAIFFVAVVVLLISLVLRSAYYQLVLTQVLLWAVLSLAWNILSGYSGYFSFGHAAFWGLGAYTVTLGLVHFDVTPWLGIPLGAVVGGVAGALIGYPTFRLRGHYFALAMLAYPLAVLYVFQWLGYQEVSLPMKREAPLLYMQFADPRVYVLLALGLLVLALAVSLRVENSRFGMALLAIKQNEPAAEAAGIDTWRWKMRAIVLSGALAAMAGGLYAVVLLVVTPESVFGMLVSAQPLILALFGGIGSLWGPVIGAVILVPLAEGLNGELGDVLPGIQGVVYGVAIIVIILLAPEGVYWRLRDRLAKPRAERRLTAAPRPVVAAAPAPRPTHGSELLVLRGIGVSFGGLQALDGIDLAVREGSLHGIIGPNGAGKTTLFNVINGFLPPDSGAITFAGASLLGLRPSQVCRRGVGRTFQVVRAFPRMTLLENVVVGAYVGARDDAAAEQIAKAALDRVGLADRAGVLAGRADHAGIAADGIGTRARAASAADIARRDPGRARPRGSRRHSGRNPAGPRRGRDGADHRAYDAGDGAARRCIQRARPRQADRRRTAE